MKNDCASHSLNPSLSILIQQVFATSFPMHVSIIATAGGSETANGANETINSFNAMPRLAGATGVNVNVTAIYGKEVNNRCNVIDGRDQETIPVVGVVFTHSNVIANTNNVITDANDVLLTHCMETGNVDDVMRINYRSNTVQHLCNEDQYALQYASTLQAIQFNVPVIGINVVVMDINVNGNAICCPCNRYQSSYQYGSAFVQQATTLMKSPSKPAFLITLSESYDTPAMQQPPLLKTALSFIMKQLTQITKTTSIACKPQIHH